LDQELTTQTSRYNELEGTFLLMREQSASMDEKIIVYFQNQNLDVVTEKSQVSDIQSQHATMEKESRSEEHDMYSVVV
jgi:hypothetical protein